MCIYSLTDYMLVVSVIETFIATLPLYICIFTSLCAIKHQSNNVRKVPHLPQTITAGIFRIMGCVVCKMQNQQIAILSHDVWKKIGLENCICWPVQIQSGLIHNAHNTDRPRNAHISRLVGIRCCTEECGFRVLVRINCSAFVGFTGNVVDNVTSYIQL